MVSGTLEVLSGPRNTHEPRMAIKALLITAGHDHKFSDTQQYGILTITIFIIIICTLTMVN